MDSPAPVWCCRVNPNFFTQGFGWVAERDARNSLTLENSCTSPNLEWARPSHEGERRDARESRLDVAFLSSVCLGHEESG